MARRIKFDLPSFEALRTDPAVQKDLVRRAKAIAEEAGGEEKGYIVRENLARENRAGVTVMATGYAGWSNRLHQSLIHALPAGGD